MTLLLYGLIYSSALVFLAACVIRAVRYARMPVHLRWELYPVPHEDATRVKHGGSYFETTDWWTQPTHFNLWGELKVMVPEMLFLKGLWEFNRKMWFRSFPFHFGLYLLIGASGLVTFCALLGLGAPEVAAGALGPMLHYLAMCTGLLGSGLCLLGAVGLLIRRLSDEELKTYTTKGDIFNLLFFVVAIGLLLFGYVFRVPDSPGPVALVRGLLTFDTSLRIPGMLSAGLFAGALLVAYIPLTHMSHFIAKYFTYHSVRWDDVPSAKRAKIQAGIAESLTYRPTWSAAHVGADGLRTWSDIAMTNPTNGTKK